MAWKVTFFESVRGESPVTDFLEKVDVKSLDKIQRSIDILIEYGPHTPYPFSKRITEKISELRSSGKNSLRILYGRVGDTYILLHVFKKKTNKLPTQDYKLSEKRYLVYISTYLSATYVS